MTDTLLDIPTRPAFVTTTEPAFDFMRLIAGRADGRAIAKRFFAQPDTRTVDEDLIDAMINAFNADEPPKDLNDLRERVDGLGDVLAERLSTALAANGALRRSNGRLNPALIETLSDPSATTDDLCPPAVIEVADFDFNTYGQPSVWNQPGGIQAPGAGHTGLDKLLAGCTAYALERLALARAENHQMLVPLLDEFEDAATRLACRLCGEHAPRTTVQAFMARAHESLSRARETRHAEERFETALALYTAEIEAASVGGHPNIPMPWLQRVPPFPAAENGDTFIGDPKTPALDTTYELSVQLNQVTCKIETTPKWGADEFRIATAARVDGTAVASANYAEDFDETAPGNSKVANLEFFKFEVPKEKGVTKSFRLLLQPYESDAITAADLAPYVKILNKVIEALVDAAIAPAKQRITAKITQTANTTRRPSTSKTLQRVALEALDKSLVTETLNQMVGESALKFFNFFNGPDAFTLVTLQGSVTSNGPKDAPTWQFTVTGGTPGQEGKFANSVTKKAGLEKINQLKIHEVNAKGSGKQPFTDPDIGAYQLDMSVVVREKPKSA